LNLLLLLCLILLPLLTATASIVLVESKQLVLKLLVLIEARGEVFHFSFVHAEGFP
jgi:hypothetical protein